VQTACLAHDIGNPPFGHTGEDVIKKWFSDAKNKNFICELTEDEISDFKNFDGNAQSFRIVTQLENNPFNCGMRLTFATLATLIKYPYPSSECISTGKEKFSFFQSESEFFDDLFSHMGLKKKDGKFIRHPLSYLMEAGDDICYGLLDLQDAIELDLIKIEDVRGIFDLICGKDFVDNIFVDKSTDIQKVSRLIANAINNLTNHTAETFRNNFNDLLNGSNKCLISLFSKEDLKEGMDNAKNFAKEKIFSSKIDKEKLLGETIKIMLDYLIKATYNLHRNANKSSKSALDIMSYHDRPKVENSLYENYQRVLDYIVGMTDNYAVTIADRLNKGEF
jgi:dGTPase